MTDPEMIAAYAELKEAARAFMEASENLDLKPGALHPAWNRDESIHTEEAATRYNAAYERLYELTREPEEETR